MNENFFETLNNCRGDNISAFREEINKLYKQRQVKIIPLAQWENEEVYNDLISSGWELEGYTFGNSKSDIPTQVELVRYV